MFGMNPQSSKMSRAPGIPKARSHPPGQNHIGPQTPHPNMRNAATGIKSNQPTPGGFMNRVERKP